MQLPGDDMKGRIIGREGRNIRSFEQVTGVNLVIDDTPEAVLLSCFDPVRREVARLTLEELIGDGRIHPSRIEEVHERSAVEVDRLCVRAGEDAALEMGITDLHPHLVETLGRLRYRTSYGQNVLAHLVESGHAAGLLADELGVDRATCVRGRVPARHRQGADPRGRGLATRWSAPTWPAPTASTRTSYTRSRRTTTRSSRARWRRCSPRPPTRSAAAGPGARRESLEAYVERLHRLEEIAMAKQGVVKVFAMQAGRDVRVMVAPDAVDDIEAQVLARDIAKQFEQELTYPGQIKVTVIRESRATETAR